MSCKIEKMMDIHHTSVGQNFHFSLYYIVMKSSVHSSYQAVESTMVDTVNVTRQMQRNAEAGIAD